MAFLDVLGWPRPPEEVREKRAPVYSLEAKDSSFLNILNANGTALPVVTIDIALTVPAVWSAVNFLPRTLSALPLHAYRKTADGPEKISGGLEIIIHEAPNAEWTSFKLRQHFWQQVFTGGRGLLWIERAGTSIVGLWPINPAGVEIKRNARGQTSYNVDGKTYPAADIIDVPFMLKADGLGHYGPITAGTKAIQLALAMGDYGAKFFNGGGVPPLAIEGPIEASPEARKRALDEMNRSIAAAQESAIPIARMPPGYKLTPIGFDPDKGQMTDGRRFQVEEIARIFQLPPVFLQDLTHGTFTNTEQQDLFFVKHLIGQWAQAFEEECNLKLFGQKNGGRYVEHNLDGLMRGDLVTRMTALAAGVQNALLTPDEGRLLDNRAAKGGNADKLFIQGATIPIDQEPEEEEPDALAEGLAEGLADE